MGERLLKFKPILAALVTSILIFCLSTPINAQVAGAMLTGTVMDSSRSGIPKAKVTITNVATGVATTVEADSAGIYTAPNLTAGTYDVSIEAAGFSTEIQRGVTLTVGAKQVLDIPMSVGQLAQTINVTASAPTVELESSTIGAVVNSTTVRELPLNGRDWTTLATLQPAVSAIPTQQPTGETGARGNRGYGNEVSISGTRPQLNNYRLDGISIVDYSGGSPGSVAGVALGVDAIAEFSVLTSNQSAEYGRTSGGVINAITRSGTNQIHGDAYWFLRDEDFDARNFFDTNIAPFHRNQFGASAGGPIQKDKTFFFADYEGIRQSLGVTNVDNVPSQDARNGLLHNPDGTTTTVTVDPLVKPFFGFYPLPNAGLVGQGDTGLFKVAVINITRANFVTARIDRKFSEKDSVFGTWFYDTGLNDQPDTLNNVLVGNTSVRQMIGLEETHIFNPSLVNSLRGGFNRVSTLSQEFLKTINPLMTDFSLGSFPGQPPPGVSVPGLTYFVGGGLGPSTSNNITWNSFQAYDDAFLTKGVHSLKFGFAFERMQTNLIIPSNPNGGFTFGSLADFLTNQPLTFHGQVPSTVSPRGVRQSLYGGYLQDDWRWHPNLTLNLGLRYEMVTVPTEVQNKLVNLPTFTSAYPGHLGSPYFNNPTLRDFEPRIGFSWDPFHNGTTAVRGGFGIFDALPLNYEFFLVEDQSAPFELILTTQNLAAGSFPKGAAAAAKVVPSSLQTVSIQSNPPRNYVMIWNLNVQHQLTPSTAMTVSYVGNHGVHMLNRADDVNLVIPTATPLGYMWPTPAGSGKVMNPNVGAIRGLYWGGNSQYDALEVEVEKRMSHGFQAQGSYTWGKNIDTGSASVIGDPFTNSISSLLWFCNSCRRGLSDFDIAQTLEVNYFWDVPTPKNWGAIGSHILGGWEVGGIFEAETGVPITPLIGGDPLGLNSSDPFAYPNRLTGPGCSSVVNPGNPNNYIKLNCFAVPMATASIAAQCTAFSTVPGSCSNLLGNAGRNTVVGPGLLNFDFSLFKNNYIKKISENCNLQFRAEFFNILNRANFAAPVDNQTLFDQTGALIGGAGSVDKTSTTSRQIQFALKLIW